MSVRAALRNVASVCRKAASSLRQSAALRRARHAPTRAGGRCDPPIRLTVDNSVVIASIKAGDHGHVEAREAMAIIAEAAEAGRAVVHQPAIYLLEVTSSYMRQKVTIKKAYRNAPTRPQGHSMKSEYHDITTKMCFDFWTWHIARCGDQKPSVKGSADLTYMIIAVRMDTILLSQDGGLLDYDGKGVRVLNPAALLADRALMASLRSPQPCPAE